MKPFRLSVIILSTIFILTSCNSGNDTSQDHSSMDHSSMNHTGSSEVASQLKKATQPQFKIGSKAILIADHMAGMKGATATIKDAYETYAYSVTYDPTNGGETVNNHKWVYQGEIENANDTPFKLGDQVVLEADHLEGMKGATAKIDSVELTILYMVDYEPTTGGEKVVDHKWVTENELKKP
jgi:hypothetical protein